VQAMRYEKRAIAVTQKAVCLVMLYRPDWCQALKLDDWWDPGYFPIMALPNFPMSRHRSSERNLRCYHALHHIEYNPMAPLSEKLTALDDPV
jgi:hypothetical protein